MLATRASRERRHREEEMMKPFATAVLTTSPALTIARLASHLWLVCAHCARPAFVRAGLAIAAVLTIAASGAHALPPGNAPGGPPCHIKKVCITKYRVCPPLGLRRVPCTPGPYQSCTTKRVCADL